MPGLMVARRLKFASPLRVPRFRLKATGRVPQYMVTAAVFTIRAQGTLSLSLDFCNRQANCRILFMRGLAIGGGLI
jgi:hypothetical protein